MKVGGQKGVRNWQKRWMVLQDHTLSYFKNQKVGKVSGEVDMRTVTSVEAEAEVSKKKPNSLAIYTPSRTYYLQCQTPDERASWIDALRSHMSHSTVCSPASPNQSPRGGASNTTAQKRTSASPSSSFSSASSSLSSSTPTAAASSPASSLARKSSAPSSTTTATATANESSSLSGTSSDAAGGKYDAAGGKYDAACHGAIQRSGFLFKVGGKKAVKSHWQRRYVVLRERALLYYRTKPKQDTDKFAGSVLRKHIEGSEALDDHHKRYAYCFCVVTHERTFYFAAEDDSDRVQWLLALSSAANDNE